MKKGLIQVYTGNGKGKTTAAVGQAIRALGRGYKVCFIQFFKQPTSGEIKILKNFPDLKLVHPLPLYPEKKNLPLLQRKAKGLLSFISKIIKSKTYDLVILDEVNIALREGFLDKTIFLDLLKNKPKSVEVILTGRGATEKIIKAADLVTEMKEIKHPFKKGVKARKGIEY